jgi:hypothetical protein
VKHGVKDDKCQLPKTNKNSTYQQLHKEKNSFHAEDAISGNGIDHYEALN